MARIRSLPVGGLSLLMCALFIGAFSSDGLASTSVRPSWLASPSDTLTMATRNTGWFIGQGTLWRTTDGAQVWNDVTPGGTPRRRYDATIATWGAKDAWVAMTKGTGSIQVDRSADGGRHWSSARINLPHLGMAPFHPRYLTFANPRDGWLEVTPIFGMGMNPAPDLFSTTDGGATWHLVSNVETHSWSRGILHSGPIHFSSATAGWMVATMAGGQSILRWTHKGGRSWHTPKSEPSLTGGMALTPLRSGGSSRVLAPSDAKGRIMTAIWSGGSLGRDWTRVGKPFAGEAIAAFGPSEAGLAWMWQPSPSGSVSNRRPSSGILLATSNDGLSWHAMGSAASMGLPVAANVEQLDLVTPRVGFAVVRYGHTGRISLLKTVNGGRGWVPVVRRIINATKGRATRN